MPHVEITSAQDGKYVHPHERKAGPWDDYELRECGNCLERAEQIKANPKLVEAIAKHHESKAKEHRKLAEGMKVHMKRGMVSEKAMDKAARG